MPGFFLPQETGYLLNKGVIMDMKYFDESKYVIKLYPHFDKKINFSQAKSYVTDSNRISQHSFFPLIHYQKKLSKYSDGYIDERGFSDIHRQHIKPKYRNIMYASHIDSYIYKYYGDSLNEKYNQYAKDHGIDVCSVAYRNNKKGQCNIQFACEVFEFIYEQESCYIRVGDFEKFFDRLDHVYLKMMVEKLLNVKALPLDWYKVFKSVTKYAYVEKDDIVSFYDRRNERYFSNTRQFRQFRKQHPEAFKRNHKDYGIPQGTAISGVLANVYMMEVDQAICELVSQYGGIYRRYSDDTIIIVPKERISASEWKNLECKIKEIISTANVTEQEEKTHKLIYQDKQIIGEERDRNVKNLDYLGFTFNGENVLIRQKCIYKFERKASEAFFHALMVKKQQNLKYLPYKSMLLRYCLKKPYKMRKGKRKRQSNFLSYVRRTETVYGRSELQCVPQQQIYHLQRKIKQKYERINGKYK